MAFVSGPLVPVALRGTQNSGLSHACDWFATVRQLANVNPADSKTAIDSMSLVAMLFSEAKSPRTSIVHDSTPGPANGTAATGKIRSGDWYS